MTTSGRWPAEAVLRVAVLGICSWACLHAHAALLRRDRLRVTAPHAALGAAALQRMALTYRPQLADVYYLRAVNAFGSKAEHRAHYPSVAPLLKRSSLLDGSFAAPYLLAGTALTSPGADNQAALALLQRGAALRPDVWRIHLLYGFELFTRGHTRAAAQAMAQAAALTEAPPFVRGLAVRLAAESGDPALGIAMIDGFAASVPYAADDDWAAQRRAALVYQQTLAAWQARLARFTDVYGRAPRHMAELARSSAPGEAASPSDPWGAPLVLDDEGHVTSIHRDRLLRIHREPAPPPP